MNNSSSSLEKLSAVAGELAADSLEQQILRDYIARLEAIKAAYFPMEVS